MVEAPKARGYLPIDGIAAYDRAVQGLGVRRHARAVTEDRIATVQALGGTGGLKVGADFLKRLQPQRQGADQRPELGEPPRAVHAGRLRGAELPVLRRRRPARLRFDAMLAALNGAARGTVVVLHACCHNPTGYDLTAAQWAEVVDVGARARLVPSSTWPTRASARASPKTAPRCASSSPPASTSSSRHRSRRASRCTASASARCAWCAAARDEAQRVLSQLKIVIRDQLLQPADARRAGRGDGAADAGAARAVGRGAGPHARAHQADARQLWSPS